MSSAAAMLYESIKPRAIFFDDKKDTVSDHVKIAKDYKIEPVVVSTAKALLKVLGERRANDRLYVDMHMPNILDFRDVGYEDITTVQGAAVAIGVIRGLLPAIAMQYIPTRVLTIHAFSDDYKNELDEAREEGMDVDYFNKDNLDKIKEDFKILSNINKIDDMKKFAAANKVLEEWVGENYKDDIPKVFGYSDVRYSEWLALSKEIIRHYQSDIKMRAEAIIFIKVGLDRAFGEEASIQNEMDWLREPDELVLAGKSPWENMISGEIQNLMKVASMVGRIV